MTDPDIGARTSQIRLVFKIIAYAAAWIAALLLTAPGMWPLVYMFPLGLMAVVNRHLANDGGWGVFFGLYIVYIVHGYFYFRSRTTLRTVVLFAILVALLTANVAGCHEMIHSH
jgi:hypothetical protein